MRYTITTLLLLVPAVALAQKDARVPDTDPEVERRSFEVADGFEVTLFASEQTPLPADANGVAARGIAKPIQINFDAKGRLWIASSTVYPQIKPGQKANDKILILEDTDADGVADKTTIFADGLLIPTGVEPGDGGAYVANSTEILFLKDTDGDDRADERQVVLSGFGTEDTHHIIHTFRWGNDGLLYFNQSTYIHSHVETPWGPRLLNGGGIWGFRPESRQLEVFARGLINPWGHEIDAWGQHFATDGAGGEGINYMIPGASYAWTPGASRIVAGLNPGSPKHCGLEILSGRHMPEEMQGVLVTHDFRANRVCRFELSDDGSGFASRELPPLITTRFPAFRPVDVRLGPDGALYIADWYNPIIQHGEVDFRDPRRDHSHGRIWRVTAKGRPLVERPNLVDASVPELLDHLKATEGWTRHFAKRILKERGTEAVVPALGDWLAKLDPADPQSEHHKLEALWTYQSLDVPEPDLLTALLHSPEPKVRAAAVRVIPFWKERLGSLDPLTLLAERVEDEHPRVRLEAVRALGQFEEPRALEIALRALDRPIDKFLDYGLWLTCRELQPAWLPALQAGTLDLNEPRKLSFALQAAGSPEVVAPLLQSIAQGQIAPDRLPELFRLVGTLGNPDQLAEAIGSAASMREPARQAAALRALADASAPRNLKPTHPDAVAKALRDAIGDSATEAQKIAGLRAVAAWKVDPLRDLALARAEAESEPIPIRIAAIEALTELGEPASVDALGKLAKSDGPPEIRSAAVIGLAAIDAKAAAERAVDLLSNATPVADVTPIFAAFASRRGGPEALTAALADQSLPRDVARVGVRVAEGSGRPDQTLIDALTKAGKLDASPPPPTPEELKALVADVARLGDPARGEALFRRQDLQCLNCHAIAGAGGQVGPGLESIGASAPVDYLIDSLLQPNKAVKEGYHSIVVATVDGRVLTGIVLLRTENLVVLRDADGQEIRLATDAIDEEMPGKSLMPQGLTDTLTRGELLDLVRFLSELGKPGPYAVKPQRLVRRWEVLPGTPESAYVLKRVGFDAAMAGSGDADLEWLPAYSSVAGALPLSDVPTVPERDGSPSRKWVRFAIDVSTGGPLRLGLNSDEGLTAWIDGQRIEPSGTIGLDLEPGRHVITFAIDPARPEKALAVELLDAPGSSAKAQIVLGK